MDHQNSCGHDKGSWKVFCDRGGNWVLNMLCEDCGTSFGRRIKWNDSTGTIADKEPTFDILGRLNWPNDRNK